MTVVRKRRGATPAPSRARKRFGQHFLEPAWVEKVIRAIDPKPDETFLEIGPGHGALTRPLAARARHVTAFEIDRDLAAELRASRPDHLTVVEGDFLRADVSSLGASVAPALRVAGNLPYNVASPILFALADWSRRGVPLTDATVMLQLEVAERLAAAPGSRRYGVLSVLMQHRANVTRLLTLPPGAFRPAPKVTSAVVRLRFHPPEPATSDEEHFARVVQTVFGRRRKTLANALAYLHPGPDSIAGVLNRLGIDGRQRPETLSVSAFVHLAEALRSNT